MTVPGNRNTGPLKEPHQTRQTWIRIPVFSHLITIKQKATDDAGHMRNTRFGSSEPETESGWKPGKRCEQDGGGEAGHLKAIHFLRVTHRELGELRNGNSTNTPAVQQAARTTDRHRVLPRCGPALSLLAPQRGPTWPRSILMFTGRHMWLLLEAGGAKSLQRLTA